ncbi:MAG: hypothetical protein IPK07_35240 [Deltaproteobacteria bacterium]|nr:hypothetical protein [Deltaproteobacteria bacterium]
MEGRFEISSRLAADSARLWQHASSLEGVNRELMPLCRMTFPAHARTLTEATVPLGQRLFRSWILLGGVLPVDYDDLVLVELETGRRFLERSTLASQRVWEHERTLVPMAGGVEVTDRLRFEPRMAWMLGASRVVVRALFTHRHRRLRAMFGTVP